ncbi:MAG TPA: TlpA disulfide reductase family protein [Nocardioidaceae bacterium]|jgi:thiol-disulfide isomerase/thioredoxin|nr:TlpA disulfide reductase family protein [Nocardioidaceae bacterium]
MTPTRPVTSPAAAAVATVVAVAGGALAGCSGGPSAERATGGYVQDDYGITVVPAGERDDAPALGGETLDGGEVTLDDYAGRTVVLNVWGQWCPPCRAEADELVAAERALGDDVAFLGVNIRDLDDSARAFERSHGITWPSIIDQDSSELLGFRETSLPPPASPPTTYVIDAEGRLAARIGQEITTATTLVDIVDEVVDG